MTARNQKQKTTTPRWNMPKRWLLMSNQIELNRNEMSSIELACVWLESISNKRTLYALHLESHVLRASVVSIWSNQKKNPFKKHSWGCLDTPVCAYQCAAHLKSIGAKQSISNLVERVIKYFLWHFQSV